MSHHNEDPQKDQTPQQPPMQGGHKNNEEVGEPVQLNNDKQKQGQQDKPGMGQQREGDKMGQQHGGGHQQESHR